jgi:hypothetical protein
VPYAFAGEAIAGVSYDVTPLPRDADPPPPPPDPASVAEPAGLPVFALGLSLLGLGLVSRRVDRPAGG